MEKLIRTLADELGQKEEYVKNVIELIDEGATIPFIARYRKEMHGSMDDQLLRTLADRLQYLRNLAQRKEEVKNAIDNQDKLTAELAAAIACTLAKPAIPRSNASAAHRPTPDAEALSRG